MSVKKKTGSMHISEDVHLKAKIFAAQTKQSLSALIEKSLLFYIKNYKDNEEQKTE